MQKPSRIKLAFTLPFTFPRVNCDRKQPRIKVRNQVLEA